MDDAQETNSNDSQLSKKNSWTVSLAGISKQTGLLVQVSRTSEGTLKDALSGLQQINDLFEAKTVGPIGSSIGEILSEAMKANIVETPSPAPAATMGVGDIRVVKVSSMKLMFTPNGNPQLLCKAEPGLMKHGVPAWSEVFEPLLGVKDEIIQKYGVAKDIPVPDNMKYGWVEYVEGKPHKMIGFSSTPKA